jgi:PBP1b-binding outer membrane lipoprotein LpoB
MKNIKLGLIIAAGIMLVAACAPAPVLNISKAPVQTVSGQKASLDEVGKAITRAGVALGWEMKTVKPGNIIGTLKLRNHLAVVDITYDTQTYSITYKDSTNLKYNGETIHKNYNSWIKNLDQGIRTQLSAL